MPVSISSCACGAKTRRQRMICFASKCGESSLVISRTTTVALFETLCASCTIFPPRALAASEMCVCALSTAAVKSKSSFTSAVSAILPTPKQFASICGRIHLRCVVVGLQVFVGRPAGVQARQSNLCGQCFISSLQIASSLRI